MIKDREGTLERTIREHGGIDGVDVLDVGCGSGEVTRFIARHAASAVGLEEDPRMLARAESLAADGDNLRFEPGSAQTLPFADDAFGAVTFLKSLHHVPPAEQDRALAEARRVLAPGGTLLVVEPVYRGGAYEEIVHFYNDEREVREAAERALRRAVDSGLLRLEARLPLEVFYECDDFADLFAAEIQPKPWVRWDESFRPAIEALLDRSPRTAEGRHRLDYHLTVWSLRPAC